MNTNPIALTLTLADAWHRIQRKLDSALGAIRGISLAEYRLLSALGSAPNSRASRIDLAQATGLTASGVTRALRPMEKTGIVVTVRSKRDARLAIAALTPAGRELLKDADQVVSDTMTAVLGRSAQLRDSKDLLCDLLVELGR